MSQSDSHSTFRFGEFELDITAYELRRGGQPVHLERQPMDLLILLVERRRQLVSRTDIVKRLWDLDVFVDVEVGVNTAIRKLRQALRDSQESPAFIETISGKGYRFIAPVVSVDGHRTTTEHPPKQHGIRAWAKWAVAGVILLVICTVAYLSLRRSESGSGASVEVVPLAGLPGRESGPAFSPDGNQVAFWLEGVAKEKSGIYTALVGGGKPLQLTASPDDCCPQWSPDGSAIAFAHRKPRGLEIIMIPALGGTPRRLHSAEGEFLEHLGMLPYFSWSPDGKYLAVSALSAPEKRPSITLVSLATSATQQVTSPPGEYSDWFPAFSPDGRTIAFVRASGPGEVDDLYLVATSGGEPKRLTFDSRWINSPPSWTADSRELIFPSNRAGPSSLWRISASGGAPKRIEGAGPSARAPAVARNGHRFAYVAETLQMKLWMVAVRDVKHTAGPPRVILPSKVDLSLPYFSPDGGKIAFGSAQSGYEEIWTVNSDGTNLAQLTFLTGFAGTPRWSYDGRYVSFDYRPAGHSEVYIADVSGALPRLIPTIPGADNTVPSWSRDGKWLYFSSNRGNEHTHVWKVASTGGTPMQLTKNGGTGPIESSDGFVYYSIALETDEIWKVPAGGGEETLVMKGTGLEGWDDWALAPTGIYFIIERPPEKASLRFFEFASRKTFTVLPLPKWSGQPALSPDGKSLVYRQLDQHECTIMLVNHFR